jgi:D-alanyl-D-alanine carboxypeptidase
MEKKEVQWTNTHRLLHERDEYVGIKTGVTITAGPCLASCLRLNDRNFIIIVLNSKKLSLRFTDTEILRQWLSKKEKLKCSTRRLR